jgi:hypothetical protein
MLDSNFFTKNWHTLVPIGLSVVALMISGFSVYLDFKQQSILAELERPKVALDCDTVKKPMSYVNDGYIGFIKIPVVCDVTNLSAVEIGLDEINAGFYVSEDKNKYQIGRGDELYRSFEHVGNLKDRDKDALFSNDIALPSNLPPRRTVSFQSSVLVPYYYYKDSHDPDYESEDFYSRNEERMYALGKCFSSEDEKDDFQEQLSCVHRESGKPLVSHLYEGAEFPVPHIGYSTVNGVGIEIVLYDDTSFKREIDLRCLYGHYLNENIQVLSSDSRFFCD